jgi:putative hydrolase of the HAD superfamily
VTLVFDIGGVLIANDGYLAFQKLLNIRISDQAVRDMWLKSPSVIAFETGRISAPDFGARAVAEFGIDLSAEEFLAAFTSWPGDFYPGVLPTLEELSRRFRLACLSNSNALHWRQIFDDLFDVSIAARSSTWPVSLTAHLSRSIFLTTPCSTCRPPWRSAFRPFTLSALSRPAPR